MTRELKATAFVTGADGSLGTELLELLVAAGHTAYGLTPCPEAAERVRRIGAHPVMGDLREPGRWQDEVAAEWVFHLPPHSLSGGRMTRRQTAVLTRERVVMDGHLLDAVAAGPSRRVIYVTDTSVYGAHGRRAITEDEPRRPGPWGESFAPALQRLDGFALAGLPIVTAVAGWLYGNVDWVRRRITQPIL